MLLNCKKGLCLFVWILVSWTSYSIFFSAFSQTNLISVEKDPPRRGTPPGKEGTGSRGDCVYNQDKPPLTRIVGGNQSYLTVRDYPTIWIYLPYTDQEATNGDFSLQDGDIEVYRTNFKLPNKSGIIGISLPSTIPALKVGKQYRWYFDVNCSGNTAVNNSSTPASITGIVQKKIISVELARDLKIAKTPLEKILVYAKYNIWYEAITDLAQLRLTEPNNFIFKKTWIDFFNNNNFNLENISPEQIIGKIHS